MLGYGHGSGNASSNDCPIVEETVPHRSKDMRIAIEPLPHPENDIKHQAGAASKRQNLQTEECNCLGNPGWFWHYLTNRYIRHAYVVGV
jgi:hypothetical protein